MKYLQVVLVFSLFLVSCSTSVTEINDCKIDDQVLVIEPFCSFNPKVNTTVNFPVRAQLDGMDIHHEEFKFLWSSDPDFGAGAISISYDGLPLELEITEISTGCVKTAILEKSYWD